MRENVIFFASLQQQKEAVHIKWQGTGREEAA